MVLRFIDDYFRLRDAIEYSSQTQLREDESYKFAEKLTNLTERGDTAESTITIQDQEVNLVAENIGRPTFPLVGVRVPFASDRIQIRGFVDDVRHGTLTYTGTGIGESKDYQILADNSMENAGPETLSYMAYQIRQFGSDVYGSFVGERSTPPGIGINFEDVLYFAVRAGEEYVSLKKKNK